MVVVARGFKSLYDLCFYLLSWFWAFLSTPPWKESVACISFRFNPLLYWVPVGVLVRSEELRHSIIVWLNLSVLVGLYFRNVTFTVFLQWYCIFLPVSLFLPPTPVVSTWDEIVIPEQAGVREKSLSQNRDKKALGKPVVPERRHMLRRRVLV